MMRRCLAALGLSAAGVAALAQPQAVELPSLDAPAALPIQLPGHWFAAGAGSDRPAVVLLRGCGGVLGGQGRLGQRFVAYAGAYHGLDSTALLRVQRDVPNGVRPGQGVTVGGNAAARDASRRELLEFLRRQLQG